MLKQKSENFIKKFEIFNLKNSVKEILCIQEDKIKMKDLKVKTNFFNFGNPGSKAYLFVNTDQKRLQQVLLNIISNAVKFTDRNGKIALEFKLLDNLKRMIQVKIIDNGMGIKEQD